MEQFVQLVFPASFVLSVVNTQLRFTATRGHPHLQSKFGYHEMVSSSLALSSSFSTLSSALASSTILRTSRWSVIRLYCSAIVVFQISKSILIVISTRTTNIL